jgi:hypothetical protein
LQQFEDNASRKDADIFSETSSYGIILDVNGSLKIATVSLQGGADACFSIIIHQVK